MKYMKNTRSFYTTLQYCSTNRFNCTDVKQRASALFILEVRKPYGSMLPPANLHHITAGLMRHLQWNGKYKLTCSVTVTFVTSLNAEMKRLQREEVGSQEETSISAHRSQQRGADVKQRILRIPHSTDFA